MHRLQYVTHAAEQRLKMCLPLSLWDKHSACKTARMLSIIATGRMVKRAEEVAKLTTKSVEILAMPTIKPLDTKSIIESAKKTGAL